MIHTRFPLYDEIVILDLRFQFFALPLWEWGVRYHNGCLALPTMSARLLRTP